MLHSNIYTAFDVLTPEAKYWCGFIAGDGCVTDHSVQFNISWIDHEHLNDFSRFVGSQAKAKEVFVNDPRIWGDGHMAIISIGSKYMAARLIALGLVPRKCKINFTVHEELSISRDFWRGIIDADGSVGLGKNHGQFFPAITLHQHGKSIMDQFSSYIEKLSGYKFEPKQHDGWTVAMNGNKARDVVNHLYYDGCIGLERKILEAEKCKKWKGIREQNRDSGNMAWRTQWKPGDVYKYALKVFADPLPPTSEETSPL